MLQIYMLDIIEIHVTIIIRRFLHRIYTSRKMMIHSWLFHYISHCILIGKVTCRLYQKPAALNNQRYLKRVGLLCRLHIWWCRVSSITWLSSLCYFIGITILDMISSKAYVFLQCKSRTIVYLIYGSLNISIENRKT